MRKLGRILRRVLTAVSLLLFVAVLAAWVRGYWSLDTHSFRKTLDSDSASYLNAIAIEYGGGHIGVSQWSQHGIGPNRNQPEWNSPPRFVYARMQNSPEQLGDWYLRWAQFRRALYFPSDPSNVRFWRHGMVFVSEDLDIPKRDVMNERPVVHYSATHVAFPCWMAAIVFGALPSWRSFVWWRGVRRRRLASREGRCPVCGYDLRASPGRCPECGTAVGGKGE